MVQDFDVTIGELLVPGAMGGVPGDVRLRDARFTLAQPRIDDNRSGKLDVQARNIDVSLADLVAPGPGAPGFGSGALQLRGKLALTEPAIAGADPKEFAVGARSITVGIDQLAAPGSGGAPTKLSLGDVMLASPRVQVTRGAEGIVLPFGSSGAPPPPTVSKESSPPPSPAPAPTKPAIVPTPPPAVPVASAPPPPGIELDVDRFRLTDGKIVVTDRTVKPFYSGGLAPLDVDITEAALAGARGEPDARGGDQRPEGEDRHHRSAEPDRRQLSRSTPASFRSSSSTRTRRPSRRTASGAAGSTSPPRRRSARASTTPPAR